MKKRAGHQAPAPWADGSPHRGDADAAAAAPCTGGAGRSALSLGAVGQGQWGLSGAERGEQGPWSKARAGTAQVGCPRQSASWEGAHRGTGTPYLVQEGAAGDQESGQTMPSPQKAKREPAKGIR